MSSKSGAPKPNHDPGYELGDLELAPRPSMPQQRIAPSIRSGAVPADDPDFGDDALTQVAASRALADNDAHGELDSLEHYGDFDDDRSFELDLPPEDRRVRASLPADKRPSAPTPSQAPLTSNRAPRWSNNPDDEERAARELARYGDPHEGFGAPGYVLRVAQRWVSLYFARRDVEQRASEHADSYERALRDLGRALLDDAAVTQHEALKERVLLVRTRQGELSTVEEATRESEARAESELAALKAKTAAAEAELAPFRDAERTAAEAQQRLDAELKRKKAKLQRAEIELRAMSRASVPPPPERVQGVEAERTSQQTEIDQLTAAYNEAAAALSRAQRELALRRGNVDGVSRDHQQHQQAAAMRRSQHERDVTKAEHALSAALCSLAEAAEALGLAHSAHAQVAGLRASEDALDRVVDELATYDRALTIYDRPAATRGALLWLAAIVALAIVIKIF